jgi:7-keto-8-aminopelargonate synthetase-like enzyme
MDSDSPELLEICDICKTYGALLILDIAHDFGVFGASGRGVLDTKRALEKCDVIIGSFSKVFASNGGFVAFKNPDLFNYVNVFAPTYVFSNAPSPVQLAVVSKALDLTFSSEGAVRRARLLKNVEALRAPLAHACLECAGVPSPIVPLILGKEVSVRRVNRALFEKGVITNMAEYPAVPRGRARLRLQVQASHTEEQMASAAQSIVDAVQQTKRDLGL